MPNPQSFKRNHTTPAFRNKLRRRSLNVETLESRQLLAGTDVNELQSIITSIPLSDTAEPYEMAVAGTDDHGYFVSWLEADGIHLAQIDRLGRVDETLIDAVVSTSTVDNLVIDADTTGEVALAWTERGNPGLTYWYWQDADTGATATGNVPISVGSALGGSSPRIDVDVAQGDLYLDGSDSAFLVDVATNMSSAIDPVIARDVAVPQMIAEVVVGANNDLYFEYRSSLNATPVSLYLTDKGSFVNVGFVDESTIGVSWVNRDIDQQLFRQFDLGTLQLGPTIPGADYNNGDNFDGMRSSFGGGESILRLVLQDDDDNDTFQFDDPGEDDGTVNEEFVINYLDLNEQLYEFSLRDLAFDLNDPSFPTGLRTPISGDPVGTNVTIGSNAYSLGMVSGVGTADAGGNRPDNYTFEAKMSFLLIDRSGSQDAKFGRNGVSALSSAEGPKLSVLLPGEDPILQNIDVPISDDIKQLIEGAGPLLKDAPYVYGDFQNGDGADDLAVFLVSNGSWLSIGSDGWVEALTDDQSLWPQGFYRDVMTVDLNNDGYDDIIGRNQIPDEGTTQAKWYALVSDEFGGYSTQILGSWSSKPVWEAVVSGDFNGDGIDDLAGRTDTGRWWVSLVAPPQMNQPTQFQQTSYWGKWSSDVVWFDILVGDFDQDGDDDIAGRARSRGAWWVAESNAGAFDNQLWGRWSADQTWKGVSVGDFNGDGKVDIAGLAGNGTWIVGLSDGTKFTNQVWGRWSATQPWVDIFVVDADRDGRNDILGRVETSGIWILALSVGDEFENLRAGQWETRDADGNDIDYSLVGAVRLNASADGFDLLD